MRGFLQVVSLFGIPLALVIWYDLIRNTEAYMYRFDFAASAWVAAGIHVVTAFLCLHTPLWLWRSFDAMTLRRFCLTAALASFWIAARLVSSGRAMTIPILDSAAIFLIPVVVYFILSYFLFKWCRQELDGGGAGGEAGGTSRSSKTNPETDTDSNNGNA